MKKNNVIYWVTTTIVSLLMLFSAYSYFTNTQVKAGFVHLGFPVYFRIELAIAKILGVIILLVPAIPGRLKELAYFGFAFTFISAFIAHTASGDPVSVGMLPLIFLALLIISYTYLYKKTEAGKLSLNLQ